LVVGGGGRGQRFLSGRNQLNQSKRTNLDPERSVSSSGRIKKVRKDGEREGERVREIFIQLHLECIK
jgi:hypothetical protein